MDMLGTGQMVQHAGGMRVVNEDIVVKKGGQFSPLSTAERTHIIAVPSSVSLCTLPYSNRNFKDETGVAMLPNWHWALLRGLVACCRATGVTVIGGGIQVYPDNSYSNPLIARSTKAAGYKGVDLSVKAVTCQ